MIETSPFVGTKPFPWHHKPACVRPHDLSLQFRRSYICDRVLLVVLICSTLSLYGNTYYILISVTMYTIPERVNDIINFKIFL